MANSNRLSSIFSILLIRFLAVTTTTAAEEEITRFHFYFHDIVAGKNPSAIVVIKTNTTSIFSFGNAVVIDNSLTAGPDLSSALIGRAQGIVWAVSQEQPTLFLNVNMVFSTGKYNGSAIVLLGAFPVFKPVRELPIVGGTGVFRLARGYAESTIYTIDVNTGNAIYEYDVTIFHYSIKGLLHSSLL